MFAKAVLVFCSQALLVQSVLSQCISRAGIDAYGLPGQYGWAGRGVGGPALGAASFGYEGLAGCGRGLAYDGVYSAMDFTPTSGGGLPVTSGSAVAPTGLSVMSENAFEGLLAVAGELPFVGTTAVDGVLASVGAGAISHGCGNGINAMSALSESSTPASIAAASTSPYNIPAAYSPAAYSPAAYNPALSAAAYAPAFSAPAVAYDGLILDSPCSSGYAFDGIDAIEITPTSGGALPVSSASAVPPTGLAVASETAYEGPLAVAGELPFVGSVSVDGVLPTAGAGAVSHACGNGVNAMASEGKAFAGYPAVTSAYPAIAPAYPAAGRGMAPGYGFPARAGRGYGFGCGL